MGKELADIMEHSIIFATHGMHVPLDIHYCDTDQQHRSLGMYRRYTLLSRRSIRSRYVIRNFNVTGEWKYAYFVLLWASFTISD